MTKHTAVDGTAFTDEDIERWALVDEHGDGYDGAHLGGPRPGRPISVGRDARPFTVRLDEGRRAKLAEVADERGITPSELGVPTGLCLWVGPKGI